MDVLCRKNLIKAVGFAALTAAAFFPAKYINSIYGYLPGLAMLILLLLSWLQLFMVGRRLRFETEALDAQCQRTETVDAAVKIVNESFLTCPMIRAELFVSGFFDGEDAVFPRTFALTGKSKAKFPLQAVMEHIGVYTVGVRDLKIYDFMGLFSITAKGGKAFQVTVLPNTIRTDEVLLDERRLTESQNIQKTSVSDGFDYTGVREYALGDSMKRIHWKLSAHSSSYMTRITESSKRSDLVVIMDFVADRKDRANLPGLYDCIVETALSLMEQAAAKDIESSLLFVGRDRELVRVSPKGEQDYAGLVKRLPAVIPDTASDLLDGAGILEQERQLSNRSANLILCTTRITDRLIQELISVRQQQRNPELYCMILYQGESGESDIFPSIPEALGVLEEYGIGCHLILPEAPARQSVKQTLGDFR
jgi:uncharacterized protein (DUF58 family)